MPDYNLLIDIGNTFLKWGLFRNGSRSGARENRLESGHVLLAEIPTLAPQFAKFRAPAQIVISNVAGTRVRSTTIRVLEVWPDAPAPYWLIPQAEQCGVRNLYRNPAQLGSDRWAALIGARELLGGKPALVVVCGTATTIDFLAASGEFKGGVILPGVGLMVRSLHENTAALPDSDDGDRRLKWSLTIQLIILFSHGQLLIIMIRFTTTITINLRALTPIGDM